MVALRGVKKYYPIEPALYMDPQFWRAHIDPTTGKETKEKAIVHAKGNPNSRAMERALALKEEEMRGLIFDLMEKGEIPQHNNLLRLWIKTETVTFADCIQRFFEVREAGWRGGLTGSTAVSAKNRLAYAVRFAKDTPLSAMNVEWVRSLHHWLLRTAKNPRNGGNLSPNHCTGVMVLVGGVLGLALEDGHIKENPVSSYRKSKSSVPIRVHAGKSNPLSEEEVERLQAAWDGNECEGRLRAILQQALISIYTGFRVSDLALLSDAKKFALHGDHLQIESVKTRRQLKILVTKRLAAVLTKQADGSLLLRPIKRLCRQSAYLRELLKALGMERPDIIWHDLRKTFVNIMYARTGDLSAVSKAVGHTSVAVTEGHYLKASNDHIDRVMSSLDQIGESKAQVNGMEVLNEVAAMVAANPALVVTPKMAELLRKHCGMEVNVMMRAV